MNAIEMEKSPRPIYPPVSIRSRVKMMTEPRYTEVEGPLTPENLKLLQGVATRVFRTGGASGSERVDHAGYLEKTVNGFHWIHLCMAHEGDRVVGYKIGRSDDPRTFESWNGGVVPEARRRGIAAELARRQEAWCRANGFRFLQTETAYDNRAMLIVNLKQGFHVAGTYLDRETNLKIILQKSLS